MIQILNVKFDVSAAICFWVRLIADTHSETPTQMHTDTHTQRPNAKNVILGFRGPQNV